MQFKVRLFEVPLRRHSGTSPEPAVEAPGFAVDADTHDLAAATVRRRLIEDFGYETVRSINHTPDGLVAYVHKKG